MDALQMYKVRDGIPKPTDINDFGNHYGRDRLVALTPAIVEADIKAHIPSFRWPEHNRKAKFGDWNSDGIVMELSVPSDEVNGDIAVLVKPTPEALDVLKNLASHSQWVIVNPVSMTLYK